MPMSKKISKKDVLKSLSDGLYNQQTSNLADWLVKNKIKTDQGQMMEFEDHKYLVDFINDKGGYNGEGGKLVNLAGAQLGKTIGCFFKAIGAAMYDGLDVAYSLPTESDLQTIVSSKLNRLIEGNPMFKNNIKGNYSQKKIGDRILHLAYTNGQSAGYSFSCDYFLHDEVAVSNSDTIDRFSSRMFASPHKWQHFISNPGVPDDKIHRLYKQSDQKHWAIRHWNDGAGCGKWQVLDFDANTNIDEVDHIFCSHCKKPLSARDRLDGQWIKKYEDRDISGYWMHQLMRKDVTVKEMKFERDKNPAEYVRMYQGKPYAGSDIVVNSEMIKAHLAEPVRYGQKVVMGCDVGHSETSSGGHHYCIGTSDHKVFKIGIAKDFDEIRSLLREYRVEVLVIDNNPEHESVSKLISDFPQIVLRCVYASNRQDDLIKYDEEKHKVLVARHMYFDKIIQDIAKGHYTFCFYESNQLLQRFCDQFSTMACTTEQDRFGNLELRWQSANSNDHFAHAFLYYAVACTRHQLFNTHTKAVDFDEYIENKKEDIHSWLEL